MIDNQLTIAEVAKKTGILTKRVSRIIINEKGVRENTAKKVKKAIESLEYKPNVFAQSLAGGRTRIIGLLAGVVCFYSTQLIKAVLKIDDSLDVFPVHGVGGMLGIIMLSLVGNPDGFLGAGASGISESGALSQLYVQLTGIALIFVWTAVFTWIILKSISMITGLRVDDETESQGLDLISHGERGYNME